MTEATANGPVGGAHDDLIAYYNKTKWVYRIFWFRSWSNRAMHFGYFEEGIRNHTEALRHLNRVLAKRARVQPGDMLLDAGCGQGDSSLWLVRNFERIAVEGITIVPHQLSIARRIAKQRQVTDRVRFSLQDYCYTEFPDQHFSVVWACESLCHAKEKIRFYEEAYRLLKPGGRLVIADGVRLKRSLLPPDELLLKQWLNGWCCPDLDTADEHLRHLEATGFTGGRVEDVSFSVAPSLQQLSDIANQAKPWGKLLRILGIQNSINHNNMISAIKQYEAYRRGLWRYVIISAIKP